MVSEDILSKKLHQSLLIMITEHTWEKYCKGKCIKENVW